MWWGVLLFFCALVFSEGRNEAWNLEPRLVSVTDFSVCRIQCSSCLIMSCVLPDFTPLLGVLVDIGVVSGVCLGGKG